MFFLHSLLNGFLLHLGLEKLLLWHQLTGIQTDKWPNLAVIQHSCDAMDAVCEAACLTSSLPPT